MKTTRYSGTGGSDGISVMYSSSGAIIRGNRVTNTGWDNILIFELCVLIYCNIPNFIHRYAGIRFMGSNHIVEYNVVDKAMITLSDGGGLYLYAIFPLLFF